MMTQQIGNQPVAATTPLTVTLEAQHWNTVLAAMSKAPYEVVAPLIQMMGEQLGQQTQGEPPAPPRPAANGLDHDPPRFMPPEGDKP